MFDELHVVEPLDVLGIGQIQSIMYWPGEKKRQNDFMAANYKAALIGIDSFESTKQIDPEIQASLDAWRRSLGGWTSILNSPRVEAVDAQSRVRRDQAIAVGDIFLFMYLLARDPVGRAKRPSLGKAIHIQRATQKLAGEKTRARSTMMGDWKRFKPVAHLWAAYCFVEAWRASDLEWGPVPTEYTPQSAWWFQNPAVIDRWQRILAVATSFRKFGLTYVPENSKETLLDPNDTALIQVPDNWSLTVPIPHVAPHLLKLLKSYRAPKKP